MRKGKEEAEDATDHVQSLHRGSDRRWNSADGGVCTAIGRDDVGVQVDAIDRHSVDIAVDFTADSLSLV